MREFRIAVEIQAPADLVWTVMRDVESWPKWTSTVRSVQRLERSPLGVGSRALIRQPKLPPAVWQISALDDSGRSFSWVTRSPGVRVTARHWVEAHASGSRVTLSIQF